MLFDSVTMLEVEIASELPNEPELPPLPPKLSRKRTIDDVLHNVSSDPPLFSSDDASSTIENYSYQRPKRLHGGAWWSPVNKMGLGSGRHAEAKRALTRNYDSGIWMGSDGSVGDGEAYVEDVRWNVKGSRKKILKIKDISAQRETSNVLSGRQQTALRHVERAVITSDPFIDLSGMYLSTLPWKVLEPLQTFTPEPSAQYQPFASALRLSLANNELKRIPRELFALKGLHTLSLRNNQLTEIPGSISQLAPDLYELNLSVNQLRYLPAEINDLIRDSQGHVMLITLVDNLFFEPVFKAETQAQAGLEREDDHQTSIQIGAEATIGASSASSQGPDGETLYASRVAYMDIRGISVSGPVPSRDSEASPAKGSDIQRYPLMDRRIPSLYEMALRSSTVFHIEQLLDCLEDEGPQTLVSNLGLAAEQAKAGFQACSICKRRFSIARTEWIEWQRVGQRVYPLLYRGCSWACLPKLDHLDSSVKDCGWTPSDGSMGIAA